MNAKIFQNDRTNFLTIQIQLLKIHTIFCKMYKASYAGGLIVLDNKTIIERISV